MTLIMVVTGAALLACAVLGRTAFWITRALPPRHAVTLVAVAAVSLALAAGAGLTAIGGALAARLTPIAADGHWSAATVADRLPVPAWLGVAAAVTVAVLLMRAAIRITAIVVDLVRSERACRSIGPATGPRLVIADDSAADAFTLAGIHGRVVISRCLFDRLTERERTVVAAHELAHLHHRHHLYVQAAELAAAANPLLRAIPGAVRFGVERWADEEAARTTGSRTRTAVALARIALVRQQLRRAHPAEPGHPAGPVPVLGMTATMIIDRFDALLAPAPGRRTARTLLAATIVSGLLVAGVVSLHVVHETIEQAGILGPLPHRHG